ncbi:AfsR/SARP family transcriptional regulator [Roseinatronobacter sp.]|uniref:AfsR/SARP family transcriptional regulator n=1 Tax=Roseinatronobacter sp. TaxID=1945755 RepID=UPI0025E29F2C|nr:BTAD domain-containing putative transcriptional regulator [Roseibaca sp.]
MNGLGRRAELARPSNIALMCDDAADEFVTDALGQFPTTSGVLLVTDDPGFLSDLPDQTRMDFSQAGLDEVPIKLAEVSEHIQAAVGTTRAVAVIIVDMRWGTGTVSATANFERWGGLCDRIAEDAQVSIISVYARSLMIEDQLLAAVRGHSHFLAPSGLYDNPFWLPPAYQTGATISQQIGFVLGRLVPDYENTLSQDDGEASGANPQWITVPRRLRPRVGTDEIWKIRCFGRLRIYLSDGSQIKWDIPGSAPTKTKTLFAYLLQRGEKGAPTDLLAELLWFDEPDETKKRKRLHHAITMLRKTLGGAGYVRRNGSYYTLVPPEGTWIDIATFEQVCNRAKVLAKADKFEDAVTLLDAADRLYSGELFEDLPAAYFENDMENWVVPKRTWFKDMALKVLRDKAAILRKRGQFRDALASCQRALQMDPVCEIAHAEAMRIFHAQNRAEAIVRQYRQFLGAMHAMELEPETETLKKLKSELLKSSS